MEELIDKRKVRQQKRADLRSRSNSRLRRDKFRSRSRTRSKSANNNRYNSKSSKNRVSSPVININTPYKKD